MFNFIKFASLPLGLLLLGACDHDDATLRQGELQEPIACGGFAGLACPDELSCVDDPNDDCDPDQGGADCIGVCEPAHGHGPKPHKQKCGDPDRSYVSHDPDQCAAIRFKCADGEVAFFDACGCGCETA